MGLLPALLLVAVIAAALYLFLIRTTAGSILALLFTGALFIWSFLPQLLGAYGSLPPALLLAALAVGVPLLLGLAVLFRAQPVALVWGLIVTMPLRVPIPVGGQTVFLLAPLYVVILAGLLSVIEPAGATALWRQDRLRVPLAALMTLAGISLLYTAAPVTGTIRFFCFWLAFALLYHVTMVRLQEDVQRRHAVTALLASGVVLALIGVLQRVAGSVIYNVKVSQGFFEATSLRVNSLFWDPNMFGRFLVLVLVACCVVAVRDSSRSLRRLAAVAAALALPAVLFTYSRSSWITLGVAAALLVGRFAGAKKAVLVVVALILVLVIAFSVIDAPQFNLPKRAHARLYWEKLLGGRLGLVEGGLAMFAGHPLAGVGLGGFPSLFPRYRPPDYRWRVVESHNSLVTIAAELGVLGLLLLAWLVLRCVGLTRRVTGSLSEDIGVGEIAVVGLTAIFVHSLFYGALFEDPFTWLLLAITSVLAGGAVHGAVGGRAAPEPAGEVAPS